MPKLEQVQTLPGPALYRFKKQNYDMGHEPAGRGVKRAKSKYAEEHDIEFDEVAGRKLGYEDGIHLIVVVFPVSVDRFDPEKVEEVEEDDE